jgi:hypothetical protein
MKNPVKLRALAPTRLSTVRGGGELVIAPTTDDPLASSQLGRLKYEEIPPDKHWF